MPIIRVLSTLLKPLVFGLFIVYNEFMKSVICLILGGGRGTRLFPLTKDRSKSAVPLAGKYRMIDIPVSNSLNSGLNRILILTQFNSASLNQHINRTYRFDNFHEGFVDILAAEQTQDNMGWHQGTADAVRWNMKHITRFHDASHVLVINGDQVYAMDFSEILATHIEHNAEISIATIPVARQETRRFGILKTKGPWIQDFVEKPQKEEQLEPLRSLEEIQRKFPSIGTSREYLANMGIYLFDLKVLKAELDLGGADFGKDIIPRAISNRRVAAHLYNGYWEDVGTIKSFHQANMDFVEDKPLFDFYANRMYTNSRHLPPAKIFGSNLDKVLLSEGAVIERATLEKVVVGIRSLVGQGTIIENTMLMGADYFETPREQDDDIRNGTLPVGIGKECIIRNAIIDKNARVGDGVRLLNSEGVLHADGDFFHIREGIIVIPKNAVVPSGTVL